MEYKDEIINIRIEPSMKETLQMKAKISKVTLAKYCRDKLSKDLSSYWWNSLALDYAKFVWGQGLVHSSGGWTIVASLFLIIK